MPKEIPVRATFSGLKFMPKIFTVSNNSIFPLFIIQENSIIHRVFLKKEKSIQNIQEITIFRCWKTENIIISFNDSLFTFIANCQTEEDLY